jgi:hypothetical protein
MDFRMGLREEVRTCALTVPGCEISCGHVLGLHECGSRLSAGDLTMTLIMLTRLKTPRAAVLFTL